VDLGKDAGFTDAARDQLRELRSAIVDEDSGGLGVRDVILSEAKERFPP
jgi:hypothetical protein